MKLQNLGAHKNVIKLNNMEVLISYETPVACLIKEGDTWHQYKTDKKWSITTSRHINQWNPLGGAFGLKPQEYFNNLLSTCYKV